MPPLAGTATAYSHERYLTRLHGRFAGTPCGAIYSGTLAKKVEILRIGLRTVWRADAVGIPGHRAGSRCLPTCAHRTTHDRQNVDLVCAHAFERQVKPLVGVDVRKNESHPQVHPSCWLAPSAELSFQRRAVDNANYTLPIQSPAKFGIHSSRTCSRLPEP